MSPSVTKAMVGAIFLVLILFGLLAWMGINSRLFNLNLIPAEIPTSGKIVDPALQYVYGDKIFDENGTEVVWKGAGGSYLFHTDEYKLAWENHLPEIQEMGLNTIRLAFAFPDSNVNPEYGIPSADVLNYTKLDWVLGFLDQHHIKAILDLHNFNDMSGDFGSLKLTNDWVNLARHCRGDDRIAAYELFNEPDSTTWDSSIRNKIDVARAYQNLTKEIRKVDPEHIVIWESQPYLPVLETVSQYFETNTVFTVHRWWHRGDVRFQMWGVENFSYVNIGYLVETRNKLNVPLWLGEFGSYSPYNESNPEWLLTEQTLFRSTEEAMGWNLWMGRVDMENPWNEYLRLFPLKIYNANLSRKPSLFDMPKLTDYVLAQNGADRLEPYQIEMWHKNDYVALRPGLAIRVITTYATQNETYEIADDQMLRLLSQLTIQNLEDTPDHPGDWNTEVFVLGICDY